MSQKQQDKGASLRDRAVVNEDHTSWPLCGYAPGDYFCKCAHCGQEFIGDKRAMECLECAAASANFLLRDAHGRLRDLVDSNQRLVPVLEALEGLLEVHDALGAGQSPSARRAREAIAQATEAGTGSVHESAVGEADAPEGSPT